VYYRQCGGTSGVLGVALSPPSSLRAQIMTPSLPAELLNYICLFLSQNERLVMRETCRTLAALFAALAFRNIFFLPTTNSIDRRLPRLLDDLAHLAPLICHIRIYCDRREKTSGAQLARRYLLTRDSRLHFLTVDAVLRLLKWPFPSVSFANIILKDAHDGPAFRRYEYGDLVECILNVSIDIPFLVRLQSPQRSGLHIICGRSSEVVMLSATPSQTTTGVAFHDEWTWNGREFDTFGLASGASRSFENHVILSQIPISRDARKIQLQKNLFTLLSLASTNHHRIRWAILWGASKLWPSLVEFRFHGFENVDARGTYGRLHVLLPSCENAQDVDLPNPLTWRSLADFLPALPANVTRS
jgi:hypothetical protein